MSDITTVAAQPGVPAMSYGPAMPKIPYSQQYFVEQDRNNKYEWLIFLMSCVLLGGHGVLFHWIPRYLRNNRDVNSLTNKRYFTFVKKWDRWTSCVGVPIPFKRDPFYLQPSVFLLAFLFIVVNGVFCYVETSDLTYQPQHYIISKRLLKVAMGSLPLLLFLLAHHDLFTAISGLQHDRLTFIHKWLGRWLWAMICVHTGMTVSYWLGNHNPIMIIIPPQIFGMIALGSLTILTWASLRFIRNFAYDFFLGQHRAFGFIMLLMSYFHSASNHAIVLISVHGLVVDRVLMKVYLYVHRYRLPTKNISELEILDEDTMMVTVPVHATGISHRSLPWWKQLLPRVQNWQPGQHVMLNIQKVSFMQYHPFTIASLTESGEMKFVIRKKNGFTKKLMKKLVKMKEKQAEDGDEIEANSDLLKLRVHYAGPYGAKHQPLITFDTNLFIGAGSGALFTFPVALNLLNELREKDMAQDYLHRPSLSTVRIVWVCRRWANISWYMHIFDQLAIHLQEGRAFLDIYITQEECSPSDDEGYCVPTDSDMLPTKTPKNNSKTEEITYEKEVTESTSHGNSTFSSLDHVLFNENLEGVTKYYCRPDIESIVTNEATRLLIEPTKWYKSLAVCSCGPSNMTDYIKVVCQKNRKAKNSPDVYCYTESF